MKILLEAHASAPERIVLDLDVTDVPLYGHQEGPFFHGYYDSYCYLPLYIFCGEHLLCERLHTADQDASAGSKRRWSGSSSSSGECGRELKLYCALTPASAAKN